MSASHPVLTELCEKAAVLPPFVFNVDRYRQQYHSDVFLSACAVIYWQRAWSNGEERQPAR